MSAGRNGSGGALRVTIHTLSSSGIASVNLANFVNTDFASLNGKTIRPLSRFGPTAWS